MTFAKSSKSLEHCSGFLTPIPVFSGGGGSWLGVMGLLHQSRLRNFLLSFSGRRTALRHSSMVRPRFTKTMMLTRVSNVICYSLRQLLANCRHRRLARRLEPCVGVRSWCQVHAPGGDTPLRLRNCRLSMQKSANTFFIRATNQKSCRERRCRSGGRSPAQHVWQCLGWPSFVVDMH
jgi:hypothetical protein